MIGMRMRECMGSRQWSGVLIPRGVCSSPAPCSRHGFVTGGPCCALVVGCMQCVCVCVGVTVELWACCARSLVQFDRDNDSKLSFEEWSHYAEDDPLLQKFLENLSTIGTWCE
jgi:hypothetical protein